MRAASPICRVPQPQDACEVHCSCLEAACHGVPSLPATVVRISAERRSNLVYSERHCRGRDPGCAKAACCAGPSSAQLMHCSALLVLILPESSYCDQFISKAGERAADVTCRTERARSVQPQPGCVPRNQGGVA